MKNMDMSMEMATMVIRECKTCMNNESGGPFICFISALLCLKSVQSYSVQDGKSPSEDC